MIYTLDGEVSKILLTKFSLEKIIHAKRKNIFEIFTAFDYIFDKKVQVSEFIDTIVLMGIEKVWRKPDDVKRFLENVTLQTIDFEK